MQSIFEPFTKDIFLSISVFVLLIVSVTILNSIAPGLFPLYLIFILLALAAFWFFAQVGFPVASLFSKHFYVISILLLITTLVIGNVTRGTIRWIPLGPLKLQPAEIVRPFLLVFFAKYFTDEKITIKRFVKALLLIALPVLLILVQPSLSVSLLTLIGFLGVLIATSFNKKYILLGLGICLVLIPVFWQVMAPYQRTRVLTFLESPENDPLGAGYNSVQSVIATGSGGIFGRGLGKGIQTQLSFLPAKQTDFIFAATGEELGFFGVMLLLIPTFIILWRIAVYMESAVNPTARAYLSGFFLIYLVQVFVHTGMNMGILPVTGLPFPLVSAGGSSLLATLIGLGMASGAYKR